MELSAPARAVWSMPAFMAPTPGASGAGAQDEVDGHGGEQTQAGREQRALRARARKQRRSDVKRARGRVRGDNDT